MSAAALADRITLQTATITRDSVGGPVETWADTITVWANVVDLTGKAINEAQQVGSLVNRRVTIRWRASITAALRVKFADGRTAKVAFVRESQRREYLELHCEKAHD